MSFDPNSHLNADLSNFRPEEIAANNRFSDQLRDHISTPDLVMANFSRFVRFQDISRFLVMRDLFMQVLHVHGSVIELGVLNGFNVFTLGHLSEIYEPRNFTRRIYGFDTFEGYVGHSPEHDGPNAGTNALSSFHTEDYEALQASVALFNSSIQFNQFEKITLVKGDASETAPKFVGDHSELIVSLLLCQCDTYQPTYDMLAAMWPRMTKGSIVAFGASGYDGSPGETKALNEVIGIGSYRIQRFPYSTKAAYIVKD